MFMLVMGFLACGAALIVSEGRGMVRVSLAVCGICWCLAVAVEVLRVVHFVSGAWSTGVIGVGFLVGLSGLVMGGGYWVLGLGDRDVIPTPPQGTSSGQN